MGARCVARCPQLFTYYSSRSTPSSRNLFAIDIIIGIVWYGTQIERKIKKYNSNDDQVVESSKLYIFLGVNISKKIQNRYQKRFFCTKRPNSQRDVVEKL